MFACTTMGHIGIVKVRKIQSTSWASRNDTLIKKTIKSLKLENGNSVGSDKKILEEASSFYKKLYTSLTPKPNFCKETFFPENLERQLSDAEKESCEGTLKSEECLQSLKSMENNKSPGSDGLPAEFYKLFWQDVNIYLVNALNTAYRKGVLSMFQRRGLITLLPKKNKILQCLKNWRPYRS